MLASRTWIVWASCGLVAGAMAQNLAVTPSNISHYAPPGPGERYFIIPYCSSLAPIPLIPLSIDAVDLEETDNPITNDKVPFKVVSPESNTTTLNGGQVAYVSCDPDVYRSGNVDLGSFILPIIARGSAVVFYSLKANYCNVAAAPGNFLLFSMTSIEASRQLAKFHGNAQILQEAGISQPHKPLCHENAQSSGVAPSTAVAMIILYSITGIITGLFLVIIVTGAVRAHRHPEQYGPRNVMGRSRQSRARGIARAMLDTIPIVKFGEQEDPPEAKQKDIELAPAPAPEGNSSTQSASGDSPAAEAQPRPSMNLATEDGPAPVVPASGIAAASETHEGDAQKGLMCSICTDEFERGEDIRVLPCQHKYHPACVDPWLLNVSGTCPLCRVELCPPAATDEDAEISEVGTSDNTEAVTTIAHRRRSTLRMLLNRGSMQTLSPEERIAALRRFREEQRRRQSAGDPETPGRRPIITFRHILREGL